MKLHHLAFSLLASFSKPVREKVEVKESELEEAQRPCVMLSDKTAEKVAMCVEWSKPENIEARRKEDEIEGPKRLAKAEEMAKRIREEFNIPDDMPFPENVPTHMKGQARSTVLAMLRQGAYEYDREFKIWKKKA